MLQPPSMFTAPTDLPEDPATLQAILRAALTEIERLQLLIAGLQRNRFGRRSETLGETAAQQGTEDLEQSLAEKMAGLRAATQPPQPAAKTNRPPANRRSATAAPCRYICRGSRSSSTSNTKPVPVAVVRCI
jgi:transposase